MKSALNLIYGGIAGVVCLGLLAACDGRGITPFKSKKGEATPAQIAEYCKTATADVAFCKAQLPPQQDPTPTPLGLPTLDPNAPVNHGSSSNPLDRSGPPTVNGGGDAPPAPGTVDSGSTAGTLPAPGVITDTSKAKGFIEREDLARNLYLKDGKEGLIDEVDKKIKNSPDANAAKFVQEISFNGDTTSQPLRLSMRAKINSVAGEAFLQINDAPVTFPEGGKVYPLVTELHAVRLMDDTATDPGNSILTYAYCASDTCKHIQVLIEFAVENGHVQAAFILEAKPEGFNLLLHNIGDGLKAFDAKDAKAEEPKLDANGKPVEPGTGDNTGTTPKTDGDAKVDDKGNPIGPVVVGTDKPVQSDVDPKSANAASAAARKAAEEAAAKKAADEAKAKADGDQAADLDNTAEPEVDLRTQGVDSSNGKSMFDTQAAAYKQYADSRIEGQKMAAAKQPQASVDPKSANAASAAAAKQVAAKQAAAYKQYADSRIEGQKLAAAKASQPNAAQTAIDTAHGKALAAAAAKQQPASVDPKSANAAAAAAAKIAAAKQQPNAAQAAIDSAHGKAVAAAAAKELAAKQAAAYKQYSDSRVEGEKLAAEKRLQDARKQLAESKPNAAQTAIDTAHGKAVAAAEAKGKPVVVAEAKPAQVETVKPVEKSRWEKVKGWFGY